MVTNSAPSLASSRILGHVYSRGGGMIGGAKVTCNGRETITLCDGMYEFENLTPLTYVVTVSLKGFQNQSKTVSIKENEVVTLDFTLNEAAGTANIRGCIYDAETGKPISSGTVILILPFANKYVSTDKDGRYEFTNLVADTYEVWITMERYEEEKATISVKEGETKIRDFYCKVKRVNEPPWG